MVKGTQHPSYLCIQGLLISHIRIIIINCWPRKPAGNLSDDNQVTELRRYEKGAKKHAKKISDHERYHHIMNVDNMHMDIADLGRPVAPGISNGPGP